MSSSLIGAYTSFRIAYLLLGMLLAIPAAWLIVTLQPRFILAVFGAILLAALVLRWPVVAGIAIVASVPAQQVGAVGPVTMTRAMVMLAAAATVMYVLAQRRDIVLSWLLLPFAAVIAWMCVSAALASNAAMAVDEVLRWSIAFASFFILLQLIVGTSERLLMMAISAIGVVAAVQALLGVMQSVLGIGPESFGVGEQFSRAFGTFGRPNTFAGYLEMALFPVLWAGVWQLGAVWRSWQLYRVQRLAGMRDSTEARLTLLQHAVFALVLLGSTAAITAGILGSFSRGAWLGVACGIAVSAVVAVRRWWSLLLVATPLGVLVISGVLSSIAPAAVTERVVSIIADSRPFDAASVTITDENFAAVERMAHWQAGWDMFLDHPVSGVGPGNYNVEYPEYFVRTQFRVSQGHAHNYYIHALAETGAVGLVVYLALMLSALGLAVKLAFSTSGVARSLALGAVGTTVAVMAHNVFENLHVLNLGIQLVAAWALLVAASRLHTVSKTPRQPGAERHER